MYKKCETKNLGFFWKLFRILAMLKKSYVKVFYMELKNKVPKLAKSSLPVWVHHKIPKRKRESVFEREKRRREEGGDCL